MISSISFVAIVVAGCVAFIIGFLIHGPVAGKLWMRLANIVPTGKEKLSDMYPQMIANLIMNFLTALAIYVIYLFVSTSPYLGMAGIKAGLMSVFWLWVLIVAGSSMEVIWMGKKMKLWMFECVASLLVMTAMGAIIAIW